MGSSIQSPPEPPITQQIEFSIFTIFFNRTYKSALQGRVLHFRLPQMNTLLNMYFLWSLLFTIFHHPQGEDGISFFPIPKCKLPILHQSEQIFGKQLLMSSLLGFNLPLQSLTEIFLLTRALQILVNTISFIFLDYAFLVMQGSFEIIF